MKYRWFRRLLPGLLLVVLAGPVAAQTRPPAPPSPFVPGAWWRDSRKALLGLTDEQSKQIDAIIRVTMPDGRQKLDDLQAQERELSRMIMTESDEGAISRQVERVEASRAQLNRDRTLMLVRIRKVLTPEQRTKLGMLREQWEKENQPPRPGSDRDRRPATPRSDQPRTPR
ncbi:MAG: periplasmic heavy metal sensor [Vicinamibacterales bacterium]